jgi:hypothetical protein
MASHDIDGNPFRPGGNTVKRDYRTAKDSKSNESDYAAKSDPIGVQKLSIKPNKEEATRKGLCFICAEPGHRASQCKKRVNAAAGRKSVNSSACAAEPSLAIQPVAPAAANQQDVQMNVSRGACEAALDVVVNSENDCTDVGCDDLKPSFIDADEFHVRSYIDVTIEGLPVQKALIDGGSEICCINSEVIRHLNLSASKQVRLSGLSGKSNVVDVVRLHVKPALQSDESIVNIAPPVRAWFAVVPDLNESVILTPHVVSLLREVARYNVLSPRDINVANCRNAAGDESDDLAAVQVVHDDVQHQNASACNNVDMNMVLETNDFLDPERPQQLHNDRVADTDTLAQEQKACPSPSKCWELAKQNRGNLFIENDLLYHRDNIHANKIRKSNERIEQAMANNCAVIFDKDDDFGAVQVFESQTTSPESAPSSRIDPSKVAHLTDTEKRQLFAVLDKFPEVFSDKPGYCPLIEHEIKVSSDFKPKRLRAYRVPELLKPEVERQIKEMLDLGIIVPSSSEMASPVVCVLKGPNGVNGVRLAIDYRHVNRYSAGDGYPTPDIGDILQKVGRAKYISCFDAKSGYWQLPVKEESRWLTAFVCDAGLFEFCRLPYGLKSASNTFIRCISRILHPIRSFTEPFVDDMAVFSMTWQDHLNHLEKYLHTIKESGFTLSLKKCSFAQSKATFVGHVVGSGLIEPDPRKIAAVAYIKPPTTKKDVRSLIGFFSYFRNFIPSFAETSRVLTDLTQKNVPNKVPWGPEAQRALDKLKADLCNTTALHAIDYSRDFGLLVDASASTIGCCLIQWTDDGVEKPIAFASMKLSPTQTRWATIEREAFAVIWALRKFRSWLFLSKVTVFSDHNPLTFLTESAPKSAKLARWALALQEFNIDFRYRCGRKNAAADFLSRM